MKYLIIIKTEMLFLKLWVCVIRVTEVKQKLWKATKRHFLQQKKLLQKTFACHKNLKTLFFLHDTWNLLKTSASESVSFFCLLPAVNVINILRANFLYKRHFGSFFYVHVTR